MSLLHIPTDVIIAHMPSYLCLHDIRSLLSAVSRWDTPCIRDLLIKHCMIERLLQRWPQLHARETLYLLSTDTIATLDHALWQLKKVEPCDSFWVFPDDWCKQAIDAMEATAYYPLEIMSYIANYTFSKTTAVNNTIYSNEFVTCVVAALSALVIDYFWSKTNMDISELYTSIANNDHLQCTGTEEAHMNTLRWVRALMEVCDAYVVVGSTYDVSRMLPHEQLLVTVQIDALDMLVNICDNPKTLQWLPLNYDAWQYLNSMLSGGIKPYITDDFDQRFDDEGHEWLFNTSRRIQDNIDCLTSLWGAAGQDAELIDTSNSSITSHTGSHT